MVVKNERKQSQTRRSGATVPFRTFVQEWLENPDRPESDRTITSIKSLAARLATKANSFRVFLSTGQWPISTFAALLKLMGIDANPEEFARKYPELRLRQPRRGVSLEDGVANLILEYSNPTNGQLNFAFDEFNREDQSYMLAAAITQHRHYRHLKERMDRGKNVMLGIVLMYDAGGDDGDRFPGEHIERLIESDESLRQIFSALLKQDTNRIAITFVIKFTPVTPTLLKQALNENDGDQRVISAAQEYIGKSMNLWDAREQATKVWNFADPPPSMLPYGQLLAVQDALERCLRCQRVEGEILPRIAASMLRRVSDSISMATTAVDDIGTRLSFYSLRLAPLVVDEVWPVHHDSWLLFDGRTPVTAWSVAIDHDIRRRILMLANAENRPFNEWFWSTTSAKLDENSRKAVQRFIGMQYFDGVAEAAGWQFDNRRTRQIHPKSRVPNPPNKEH